MKRFLVLEPVYPAGVMGKEGKLPWHCSEEMKHFSDTTRGSPLIMGSRTFLSLSSDYLRGKSSHYFHALPAAVQ